MIKTLVVVVQVIWTVSVVGMATVIGALLGFGCHGWIGAIGFGTAGFGVGAVLAAWPELLLELLAGL
ncbi:MULTISPECIES: hypothetical protein [Bradyrhizobium]|jgi:hypothetical protein|uniref:hypothetical protein n=1 Tax=Bradyrhizobium TaxID=374 RepID=UPI0004AD03A3|nr:MULTISPECIES: hypothetical protein [Bradyrhizobium]MCS3448745.1 hypothetical protein [Bradyrhizobium elkanii]MCS3560112.1 hypothetical protein [Bradyrhizobium elkanii]MCW2150041.1 hypothetical protein [Bradyrhizobium elkanii]MCW2359985.1 hypothetical protein [Bradyrhizobium elkanii]MCW2373773.1 hypothetical protein [Bradyrhizobium elkanii]